ncbi:MAG: GntG family PLP-dependent aldolase [Bacillota bacterium]|jgi:threonine aldolase|nr:aminotransferase class I/II-fold pyridoxal phosphate-dependent enzyme [Bacillota bacterium]
MTRIELRSDTFTLPTEEMRRAMYEAEVGDDVWGEDPTVARLEALAATIIGKEAALFVPSGTMGNLLAVMTHCHRGDEVVMESECHIYYYEAGGMSAVAGVIPRLVKGKNGVLDPDDVRRAIREPNIHYAPPTLLTLENTHNRGGGTVTDLGTMAALASVARERGMKVHMDGARVFHAAHYLKVPVTQITKHVDSVMFCLSKGLSAPVGSMLAGDAEFVERARRNRKMLGGGMRQAGVLAAAGIVALEKMVDRLVEDHATARCLAEGLSQIDGVAVDMDTVQTNIVSFDIAGLGMTASEFARAMAERGVMFSTRPPYGIRAVTHRHVTMADIHRALEAVRELAAQPR